MSMTAQLENPFAHDSLEACGASVCDASRSAGIRESIFLSLFLCALMRSSEVLAAEQAVHFNHDFDPTPDAARAAPKSLSMAPPALSNLPESFSAANVSVQEPHEYSATDFSPRKPTMFDSPQVKHDLPAAASVSSVRTANAWQRLADYRGQGRVRLLTLWENTGNSVSVQAGKRGGPSLQWTSRAMNHGGATRGVLDQVFSASLAGAGNAMRNSGGPRLGAPENSKLPTRFYGGNSRQSTLKPPHRGHAGWAAPQPRPNDGGYQA